MREILRTTDPVLLSFAESVLGEAEIPCMVADRYISVMEGSIDAFPRRLQVCDDDLSAARKALVEAGLEAELISDAGT